MAEVTVDQLSLQIDSDGRNADGVLNSLISKLQTLRSVCDLSSVSDGIRKGFATIIGGAEGAEEAVDKFTGNANSKLEQLQARLRDIGSTMSGIGKTDFSSSASDSGNGSGNGGGIAPQAKEAAQAMEGGSQAAAMFSVGASLALTAAISVLNVVANIFKKAQEGYQKFTNLIKKLVVARLFRYALKVINEGLREGRENLYYYSQSVNDLDAAHASSSLNELASMALYVKNSVGAAAMPIINLFVPALRTVTSWSVMAANAVNQIVSALQGGGTYTKAKEVAVDAFDSVKKSAGGANKAAKELRKTLLSFDEINKLDAAETGSGAGGGGGSSAKVNYGDMFEPAEINAQFKDFADKVRLAISEGDWRGVGKLIGQKINEAVSKIDTKALGKKITTKISNGVKLVAGLLQETDFKKIGEKIEDFIDGAIDGIDEKAFADTVSGLLTGVIDLFRGWLTNAAKNETMRKVSYKFLIFIKTTLENLKDYLKETDWADVGHKLFSCFEDWIEGAKDADVASVWDTIFETLGTAMADAIVIKVTFWHDLGESFGKKLLETIQDEEVQKKADEAGQWTIDYILSQMILDIIEYPFEHIIAPLLNGLLDEIDSQESKNSFLKIGSRIITALMFGMAQHLTLIASVAAAFGLAVVKKFFGEDTYEKVKKIGYNIITKIKDGMSSWFDKNTQLGKLANRLINDFFSPILNAIGLTHSGLTRILDDIKKVGNSQVTIKSKSVGSATGSYLGGYYTQMKAAGGYVDRGDLFIANEAGPELIGTVNGRTAVAPNAEITGIANAVYTMGEREIAAINNLTRALNAKDMTAVVTADSIVAGLARKNRRDGVSTVPVSI